MYGVVSSARSVSDRFTAGPEPAWLEPLPDRRGATAPSSFTADGLCWWLVEGAFDLTGPEPVETYRTVKQVTASGGLGVAATAEFSFAPQHQRAVLHAVRVIRGDTVRDLTDPEAFELLRRERDLERAMLDGRLTAHLTIPDVRVGDVVETSWSLIGANPVLQGRFSQWRVFEWGVPVVAITCRLRTPPGRALAAKTWGRPPVYAERERDGALERTWSLREVAAWRGEPDTPAWWIGASSLRLTDAMCWSDVSDVFRHAYAPPERLPDDLEARAVQIEAAHPRPADRVAPALRLVQSELRYHSVTLGEGGLRPRTVEAAWESRFGDCKDASRVLSALLRRLGVEADPALVDTFCGRLLTQDLPNLAAFNHCIVRVRVDGRTYWLDPTRSTQGGRLERLHQARFGYALALVEDADLEAMGEEPAVTVVEDEEEWRFGKRPSSPARLEVRTILRSWRADHFRRWVTHDGEAAVARSLLENYERRHGGVTALEPLRFEDDPDANEIRVTEVYRVNEAWRPVGDDHVSWSANLEVTSGRLWAPAVAERRAPVDLGGPVTARAVRILHLPKSMKVEPWDERFTTKGLRFETRFSEPKRRLLRLETTYGCTVEHVEPQDVADYVRFVEQAHKAAGLTVHYRVRSDRFQSPLSGFQRTVGAIVLVVAAFNLLRLLVSTIPG